MGRNTRDKKADIVSAAGYMSSWWTEVGKAGAEIGLENADYHPLGTDEGRTIAISVVAQLAALRDSRQARPKPPVRVKSVPPLEYVPLVDKDISSQFGDYVEAYRRMGFDDRDRYRGPVAWRDPGGFTLKQHAPLAGPCHKGFQYLQDWSLQNDAPTRPGIIFWIPRLLPHSTGMTVDGQRVLMTDTCAKYDLPRHHLSNFGSAALLSGLVLAHYKLTGERVPFRGLSARSDTLHSDGARLHVGEFVESGLRCVYRLEMGWRSRRDHLGAFPLGEELGF